MYRFRNAIIPLPIIIQENIARLPVTSAPFRTIRKPRAPPSVISENWREQALEETVRRVREREDPEYSEIFAICNKITLETVSKHSVQTIELMKKRDESFRLRIATLLFDKAIASHSYANTMADYARLLSNEFPEFIKDLTIAVSMFKKLYNIDETITYTEQTANDWTKQKEKRKGYAKFITELNTRNIIEDEFVRMGLSDILCDLETLISQERTEQVTENIHQCIVFLYETAKIIPSTASIRVYMSDSIKNILGKKNILSKKSQFKLEDALKLVT